MTWTQKNVMSHYNIRYPTCQTSLTIEDITPSDGIIKHNIGDTLVVMRS